ncbi:MAG TPA: SDR family oxidoreductase [Dehalococcoidia bacterium]|nr:SDR family oxidoreductase [Dehalococcoidia bacterium]
MATDGHHRPKALITGASSGIGRAFAERLARDGHDLVLVARREDVLREVAAGADAAGARTEIIAVDLATEDGVAAIERRLAAGDIDLLINNAGFGTNGEFAQLPLEREMQEIDLNVRALTRLCHAALRPMYARGAGAVINVASTGGFQPVPYMATYAATKAFVLHFSEALHEESLRHGVTVTCLCPGPVRTGFQDAADLDSSKMRGVPWTSVDEVVDSALGSVRRRRAIAIPGALNRATAQTAAWMPRFVTRKIAGTMFRRAGKDGGES